MIVEVNKDYRITGDAMSWQAEKRMVAKAGKNKGRETWIALGYYMMFNNALESLAEYRVRTSEASTAQEIKAALRTITMETQRAARIFARDASTGS